MLPDQVLPTIYSVRSELPIQIVSSGLVMAGRLSGIASTRFFLVGIGVLG